MKARARQPRTEGPARGRRGAAPSPLWYSSMSTKHYNSYPEAAEVLVDGDAVHVIRKRQDYNQIWANEVPLPGGVLGNN